MKLKYHFFNLFISFFLVFKYKENNNLKIVNQNKFKILGEEKWDVIKKFVTRIKKEKEFKKRNAKKNKRGKYENIEWKINIFILNSIFY